MKAEVFVDPFEEIEAEIAKERTDLANKGSFLLVFKYV